MHAIRSRLATSAVTALLALTCACPVATATEETLTDLTPNGGEDTGALVLEENGVPEGTENTDEETNTDGPADDEYPLTSSEPQETGFELTSTYVTNADENPSYAASCVYGINIHGNLTIDLNPQMLIDAGFAVTDILTVSINGSSYDLPFCTKFSEVPIGESCIYQVVFEGRDLVSFCTNGGSFVESFGLAHSVTDEAGNATWVVNEGVGDTIDFTFTLKERAGNADAADIAALSYTDKREDYPHLTDEQFANFRAVVAGNISEGVLYRSASPVDPRHNRNGYADDAMKRAGVTHVINLADTEERLATFAGYDTSYFSQVSHIALAVSMNLSDDQLQRKYAQAIRYIIDNPDGVFAVHCLEGKDRTGIFVALLECLGGATLEEVVDDYMVTYYNYYGVEPGSDLYDKIWRRLIKRQLEIIFGCDDLTAVSLPDAARQYLRSGGLSDQEANTLHEILTRSSPKDPEPEPEPAPQPEPEPEPVPQPEPEPEPAPRPTPNPRPPVVPYDPWTQVPTHCPIPQPQPYVLPYDLPYDYRYDLPRSESHVLPNNLVYDLSQRFPYVLPYGNMSAVSRPEVRTSQPFAIVSQPRVTRRSSPAYSIVCPTTSRPARSLWQYAYPYDTTGLPYGYPSYYYYGNRSRAYRRSRVNAWYGLMPYILGSHTDLYPWQWDWWA